MFKEKLRGSIILPAKMFPLFLIMFKTEYFKLDYKKCFFFLLKLFQKAQVVGIEKGYESLTKITWGI